MDRAARRRHGRFYTPAPLAAGLVRAVLAPLAGRVEVCDPACGDGAFLKAARDLLGDRAVLSGMDADPVAVAAARAALPGARVECGDALRADWDGRRFDAVVGNPPWISFSGRHAQPLAEDDRARYEDAFETFRGWPSLHGLFLELGARICRGRLGLLLPAQVCDLEGYGVVRAYLRARGAVSARDCGEDAFAGVTQPCCALVWERAPRGSPGGAAPIPLRPRDPLVERLAHLPHPPPEAFGDIGVHTGNAARRLLRPGGVPIREGKDVAAFRLGAPRRTIVPDLPRTDGAYFRLSPLARYRRVPIVLRQTAARPIAALHTEPTYFRNSVLACRGVDGVDPAVVVSWLNASAVAHVHRASVREAGQRAFPQLKLRHLRALPAPADWHAPPRGLAELARRVAREGRLDLAPDLDRLVSAWLGLDAAGHARARAAW